MHAGLLQSLAVSVVKDAPEMRLVLSITSLGFKVNCESFKLFLIRRVLSHYELVLHFLSVVELTRKDAWEVPACAYMLQLVLVRILIVGHLEA